MSGVAGEVVRLTISCQTLPDITIFHNLSYSQLKRSDIGTQYHKGLNVAVTPNYSGTITTFKRINGKPDHRGVLKVVRRDRDTRDQPRHHLSVKSHLLAKYFKVTFNGTNNFNTH